MNNSNNNQINYHLSCYWINSSHNTYLPYGQIGTRTSTCYYNLLLQLYEGGCVEIDLVRLTKDNLDIKVSHDTQTFSYISKGHIKLSSIVKVLLRIMERKTKYNKKTGPVILSIDNKGKTSELETMFFKILEPLNEYIYDNTNSDYNKKLLSELNNKIIIKWCTKLDTYTNKSRCIVENSHKIAMRNTTFKFNEFISDDKNLIGQTYSQDETIKINYLTTFLNTLTNFIRIYPKSLSLNLIYSNNYKVDHLFKSGVQLVSLNMQKPDKFWFINRAIFHKDYNEISYTPYILKPKWLLGLEKFPNYYNVDIKCNDIIKIEYVGNNLPQITKNSVFENIDTTLPIFYIEYNKNNIIYRNAIKLDIEISTYKLKLFNIKDKIMQYKIDSPEHDIGTGINDCENQEYPLADNFTYITLNVTFKKSNKPLPLDIQEYNMYWEKYNKNNKNNNLIEWQQGLIKFMKDRLKLN